jgi:hypothetical protein
MRRCRKRIVGWVMLGWLFAQIVTVAHACPALVSPAHDASAAFAGATAPMAGDCEAMAKQADSNANVCQSHCVADPQASSDAQTPFAVLAPQCALAVRVMTPEPSVSMRLGARLPLASGPPPTLLFSRFLI